MLDSVSEFKTYFRIIRILLPIHWVPPYTAPVLLCAHGLPRPFETFQFEGCSGAFFFEMLGMVFVVLIKIRGYLFVGKTTPCSRFVDGIDKCRGKCHIRNYSLEKKIYIENEKRFTFWVKPDIFRRPRNTLEVATGSSSNFLR